MSIDVLPDLAAIIDPLLGLSYAEYDCWHLVRKLYREGWGLPFEDDPALAVRQFQEWWFVGSEADPLTLVQPWDVLIFRTRGMASSHVGIVFTTAQFVHTRQRLGVCLASLRLWSPRLLQIARLRQLC